MKLEVFRCYIRHELSWYRFASPRFDDHNDSTIFVIVLGLIFCR